MDKLRSLNVFQEIDFRFAEFICRKEQPTEQEDDLFNAVLCLSHFANLQHSLLPLKNSSIEYQLENNDQVHSYPLDFDNFNHWPTLFPKTIGINNDNKPIIIDLKNGLLYLNKHYRAELTVATFIRSIKDRVNEIGPELIEQLNLLFPERGGALRNQVSGNRYQDKTEAGSAGGSPASQEQYQPSLFPEFDSDSSPDTSNLTPDASNLTPDSLSLEPSASRPSGEVDWQKVAAFTALRSPFCVISGGPGTGKTTTVAKILALLLLQNPDTRIDLVAPTGKAADRLGESIIKAIEGMSKDGLVDQATLDKIPRTAQTLHRYLAYHPKSGFRVNTMNKSRSDILLIDESSMVALPMFRSVLSALRADCRVILLGDKDQLAAVETGNVLGDLTTGDSINTFSSEFCQAYSQLTEQPFDFIAETESPLNDIMLKLEHSYRFDSKSGIGQLAKLLNEANQLTTSSQFDSLFQEFADITLEEMPPKIESIFDKEHTIAQFFDFYKPLIKNRDPKQMLDSLKQFRILCASRTGNIGSEAINELISHRFFSRNDQALYPGRCIMITRNDYSLGLYNGDIGVIMYLQDDIPVACFPGPDDSIREFPPSLLPDYETSFAMTIHKSQGSEYNNIFLILGEKSNKMLSKELIYTGITRARDHVTLFSSTTCLTDASQNKTQRFSGLRLHLES